jgi:hypothetical protein
VEVVNTLRLQLLPDKDAIITTDAKPCHSHNQMKMPQSIPKRGIEIGYTKKGKQPEFYVKTQVLALTKTGQDNFCDIPG